jgi:hypothetical protein
VSKTTRSSLTQSISIILTYIQIKSILSGYFLAQLEGPEELVQNNKIMSTRIALALQDELVGNITENLPHICACTYLADEMQRGRYEEKMQEYEQCLEQQELERMPSSNPSFQPSMYPTSFPSVDPNATLNRTDSSSLPVIIESSTTEPSNNTAGGSNNSTKKEPTECIKPKSLQTQTIEFAIQRVFSTQFKRCVENPTNTSPSTLFGNSSICNEIGKATSFGNLDISTSDLLTEMKNCGSEALEIAADYRLSNAIEKGLADASPSWNWNRCTSREEKANNEDIRYQTRKNLNQLFVSFVCDSLSGLCFVLSTNNISCPICRIHG